MKKLFLALLLLAFPAAAQWVPVAGAAGGGDVASVQVISTTPVTGAATCTSGACVFTLGLDVAGAYTVASLTDSGLTAGRVPYASTAGLLADSSLLTFATGTLSATTFAGGWKDLIVAKLTDGAIASAPGTLVITKGSALGSSTLATPTVTTHDGYVLRIVSSTAFAHVVSVASGKVNGGANTTITFTSAAIGDSITLIAYQGVWYTIGVTGTITIS